MAKQDLRTIVVDVSGHGFGHLGQITPVIIELMRQYASVRVIVRSNHAASVIHSIVGSRIDRDEPPPEATLVMRTPTIVDVEASAEAYHALHARWDEHLDWEMARLSAIAPTALISDVPYLPLAAAKRLGIPTVALCSLNWLDLYRHYCSHKRGAPAIMRTIKEAYHSANIFLQPRPHMPMSDLPNRRSIGPIARIGRPYRDQIRRFLGISQNVRVVLVTFGGIQLRRLPQLPNMAGVHWIVASENSDMCAGVTNVSRLDMSFIDILASCDAVVTKVGYGTFVEAACNGVGIVSAPRLDWPESKCLIDWAQQNANFALAEGGIENTEELHNALSAVLNGPRRAPVRASGIGEAVAIIARIARIN